MWTRFSPIYGGALIYALSQIKKGLNISYKEAMVYGSKKSFQLFATRFSTGFMIFLGFIAFIIPGIILGLRFALIDMAVVLENQSSSNARKLSAKLTNGKKWKILGTMTITIVGLLIFNSIILFVIDIPLSWIGQESNLIINIIYECFVSVLFSIIYIVLFLFYQESKSRILDKV